MSEFSGSPQRETYPLVSSNDTLVMVFRDHITVGDEPTLYIKALTNASIRVDSSRSLDLRSGFTVLDYTAGVGDDFTVTVNGASTIFTEGVEFDSTVSNVITAESMRDAINAAGPLAAITAEVIGTTVRLTADASVTSLVLATSDAAAWDFPALASIGTPVPLVSSETTTIDLPVGVFESIKKVSVLRVLSGRVSVDLRSPVPCRSYFEQPITLSGNTGTSGGWPTA